MYRTTDKIKVKELLDSWLEKYNRPEFIENDPVWVPHQFTKKEDIEISGLFAAIFSWGQRKTILKKSFQLMELMDMQPYDFVRFAGKIELNRLESFVHRTFNATDCLTLVWGLRKVYQEEGGIEQVVTQGFNEEGAFGALELLRKALLSVAHEPRTARHLPSPARGSASKRMNMYFRWMVRKDSSGIDFGLWKGVSASTLICPLDVHSGRMARALGLIAEKQDNWSAACRLTESLKKFDTDDPVKYDIALFCGGMYENRSEILQISHA
ncbi:MAG: TIGR02757 family protein [Bacteroidetes bacterium]|nr:TIGR02757 family protein [Bacteroidota bacterium]